MAPTAGDGRVMLGRVVIAGGHGQVALRLGRLLAAAGGAPLGLVRNADHAADLRNVGVEPLVLDLEAAGIDDDLVAALRGAHAAVFAAGAGPGSGAARKDTVDRGAAVRFAEACERAEVPRCVQISSMGVESVRGTQPVAGEDVFRAYLRAKLAAEDDLRSRPLAWTILRPGGLTNDAGTGKVRLEPEVPGGRVPRDDVAAVVAALLDEPGTAGQLLELVGGDEPIDEAVRRVANR